jgi:rifampicin phosphotransferase
MWPSSRILAAASAQIGQMFDNIKRLDRIVPADEPQAGGKAYNCARLRHAGFHVPDGIVILAPATELEAAAAAHHPWFTDQPAGALFAVRSSGIGEDSEGQSFAGIHQTILDVTRAEIGSAIAACRASAHSAQALEYRRKRGVSSSANHMAVLVQRMIAPIAAGVAFTVNPVSGATDEIIVNAAWGAGDALVNGRVDPDEFVVRKQDNEVIFSRIGDKDGGARATEPALTGERVRELASIVMDVERHYNAPQDIEWCHDGNAFWLVQSRPITSRPAAHEETEWTRANLAEVLPDLTSPQALHAFEELLNRAERLHMGRLFSQDEALGPTVKPFAGRLYFNLSQLRHACAVTATPAAWMLKALGHTGAIRPADNAAHAVALSARLACLPDLARIAWRHLRAAGMVDAQTARTRATVDRFVRLDPQHFQDPEIWSAIEAWMCEAPAAMQVVLLLGGVLIQELSLRRFCEKTGADFERLVFPQLAIGERSVSAQQAFDLEALADVARGEPLVVRYLSSATPSLAGLRVALQGTSFLGAFERFLQEYGHRARYESDWSLPRYSEDPTALLLALRAHLTSETPARPTQTDGRREREAREAWAAFAERLSRWQRWIWLPRARRTVRTIKQFYIWRERVRSDMVRVLAAIRPWHLALAGRFVQRGWLDARDHYFLLHLEEIGAVISGASPAESLRPLAAARTRELARYRPLQMPLLMRESELARLIRSAGVSDRRADEERLTGHPVSIGCVEAEVVVVRDPADFRRMKRGAILVAPATDPSWTPLFTLASGVIVEVGGVLSHASTIAREYGLPALANVKQATRRLKTGERVRLDATNGVVYRLE